MTVTLDVTQVNDFDIHLFMHNRCVFASLSFLLNVSSLGVAARLMQGKVHPTVKPLSLPFFILLVRHCSAPLHARAQTEAQQV